MYAGFWQRLRAFIWDYFLIAAYLVIITVVFWLLPLNERLFADRIQAQVSIFIVLTLPVILYFSIFESSPKQGTFGKQKTGLIVVGDYGKRIGFVRSFARTLLKFIPWELSHTLIWGDQPPPTNRTDLDNHRFWSCLWANRFESRQPVNDKKTPNFV